MNEHDIKEYRTNLLKHYNIAQNHYLSGVKDIINKTYLTLILCGIRQHKINNFSDYKYNVLVNEYRTQEFSGEWFSISHSRGKKRKRQRKARLHMLANMHYLRQKYILDPYSFSSKVLHGYQLIITTSNGNSDNDLNDKFKLVSNVAKAINKNTSQQVNSKKVSAKNVYGAKYSCYGLGYSTEHTYTLDAELNIHAHMDMLIDCEINIKTFNKRVRELLIDEGFNLNDISVMIRPVYVDYYAKRTPVAIDLSKPLKKQQNALEAMFTVMNYTRKQAGLPLLFKRQRDFNGNKGMLQLDILNSLSLQQQINVVSCSIQSVMGRGLRLNGDCGLFSKNKVETLKKEYKALKKEIAERKARIAKMIASLIASLKNKQPIIKLISMELIIKLISQIESEVKIKDKPPP